MPFMLYKVLKLLLGECHLDNTASRTVQIVLLMYLRSTHSFALKAGFFNYTFQSYTLTNIEHSIYYMRGKTYHNQFLVII